MKMSEQEFYFYMWLSDVKGISTKEQFDEISDPVTWRALHVEWRKDLKNALIINV